MVEALTRAVRAASNGAFEAQTDRAIAVVKGGDDSRDVLSTYEQFIVKCAAGGHPIQDR